MLLLSHLFLLHRSFLTLLLLLPFFCFLIEMQVHGGEISFDAFFHQVPLYHGTEDLCMRSKCPSNSNGFFKYRAQERLPSFTPPGPYHLRVKVNDDHGEELLCVKTRLHLMPAKI